MRAARVLCCQASSAASTGDMRSVGRTQDLGDGAKLIVTPSYHVWGMEVNQHQLVWCEQQDARVNWPITTLYNENNVRIQTGTAILFRITPLIQDFGYLWTCLYPPFVTSVLMADALEAALPVLRRRRHSKDTCCWAGAATRMRCLPQKHNFDVIQCVVLGMECAVNRCYSQAV